jgi:hypothetical protein
MKKAAGVLLFMALGLAALSTLLLGQERQSPESPGYRPVTKYDPARDGEKDIAAAVAEAKRTGKRVLVEVGGDWCEWCGVMDAFFKTHPGLAALRSRNYIHVKVYSDKHGVATAYYPEPPSFPFLVVLDKDSNLLAAQDSSELESGKSYDLDKFTKFLERWAPKK